MKLLIIIYLWLHLSIFTHELGHVIAAKIVGLSPFFLRIGKGNNWLECQLFDLLLDFRIIPFSGMTYAYIPDFFRIRNLKSKLIIYVLGGSIVDFIWIIIFIWLYILQPSFINLILLVLKLGWVFYNFIPLTYEGRYLSNDVGKIILISKNNFSLEPHRNPYEHYIQNLLRYAKEYKGDCQPLLINN